MKTIITNLKALHAKVGGKKFNLTVIIFSCPSFKDSVAEPHHFYAAPAPGKNFDAAPAPTLGYCIARQKF
jgi:hypothetical protein